MEIIGQKSSGQHFVSFGAFRIFILKKYLSSNYLEIKNVLQSICNILLLGIFELGTTDFI